MVGKFEWPWVSRRAYLNMRHACQLFQGMREGLDAREQELHRQIRTALSEIGDLKAEVERERGNARVQAAYADLFRLRVNELTAEKAALTLKLDPSLATPTPIIERDPVPFPSGVSFEDMGDDAARLHGFEVPSPVKSGLAGANPTPATAEPSEFDLAGVDTDPER